VLSQGRSGVVGPEEAAALEFGYDVVDEVLEAAGKRWGHDVEAVGRSAGEPVFDLVRDLGRCSGDHAMSPATGQTLDQLADRQVLAPCESRDKFVAALVAFGAPGQFR
jgi:hypothetical protein